MQYKAISKDTAELKFYGEINYWWISAKDYSDTIDRIIAEGYKNLIIRTHCYGGSVLEANAIWTNNRRSKLNITFKVEGVAASMMAVLLMSGNRVEMSSVAKVMIHPPRSYASGQAKDFFAQGKLLKSMESDFRRDLKRKTKMTPEQIEAAMDGADNWYDAEECLQLGIAQAVYDATEFTTENTSKPDAGTPVEKIFGQYTALGSEPVNPKKPQTMDKKAIIEKFGLTGVTADSSDTAVMDALNSKIQGNEQKIQTLEQQQSASLSVQIDSVIAVREAELKTKFSDAQKATFKTVAEKSGLDVLKSVLAEIKPVASLETLINNASTGAGNKQVAEDRKEWDWDKWEKEDPAGLSKMEETNLEAFKKLYVAKFPKNEARFM